MPEENTEPTPKIDDDEADQVRSMRVYSAQVNDYETGNRSHETARP